MHREVRPELLDHLPPADPRALHSRGDLRRINALMGNAAAIAHALGDAWRGSGPRSLVELGAGDGTFLLEVARRITPEWSGVQVMLVDRQRLLTSRTIEQFEALSWHVEPIEADVFDWLRQPAPSPADVMVANLFLHHFESRELTRLLADAARSTRQFLACEPLRSHTALCAASMLGFIGCNSVTVHDARISVRAGFRARELGACWPAERNWRLTEHRSGRFTHFFMASDAAAV